MLLPSSEFLYFLMSYLVITRTAITLRAVYIVATACNSKRTKWTQDCFLLWDTAVIPKQSSFHTSAASFSLSFTASTAIV